jgi:hypothetical protein
MTDPHTFQVLARARVGDTAGSLQAGAGGRLFLIDRRFSVALHAIDFPQRKVIGRWETNMSGRVFLCPSPDGRRLYVGNSAVFDGELCAVDASAPSLESPALLGRAVSDREHLIRGCLMLSPDGRYLITGSGLVFLAKGDREENGL